MPRKIHILRKRLLRPNRLIINKTKGPWNSLELVKIFVSTLIPLVLAASGYIINKSVKKAEERVSRETLAAELLKMIDLHYYAAAKVKVAASKAANSELGEWHASLENVEAAKQSIYDYLALKQFDISRQIFADHDDAYEAVSGNYRTSVAFLNRCYVHQYENRKAKPEEPLSACIEDEVNYSGCVLGFRNAILMFTSASAGAAQIAGEINTRFKKELCNVSPFLSQRK